MPRCARARAAPPTARWPGAGLRWLLDLGERSASPSGAGGDVAAALEDLRDRFAGIYDLAPAEGKALDGLLARIADAGSIPLVFQHGDPGTWNVLVTGDGRPVFLDWEAFERRGMPLWDALYFARSHAVTVGRAGGARDALQAIRQGWLRTVPSCTTWRARWTRTAPRSACRATSWSRCSSPAGCIARSRRPGG